MSLTICTVVYNEEKNVENIAQNIDWVRAKCPTVPILVIDNASTDKTVAHLQKTGVWEHVTFLPRHKNHLGEARQQAVEYCQTEWLCFVDADCTLSPHWIEQAQKSIQNLPSQVAGVGGCWIPAGPWAASYQSLFTTVWGHGGQAYLKKPRNPAPVAHLPSAVLIYRKDFLVKAGGFSGECQFVGEDLQMSHKLREAGGILLLDPALNFQHCLPGEYSLWWEKMWRYGTARGKMAWQDPKVWKQGGLWSWSFLAVFLLGFVLVPQLTTGLFFFYLLFCAGVCWWSSAQGWLTVYLLMLGTHWFYAVGMFWGLLKAAAIDGLKWRPFSPRPHRA